MEGRARRARPAPWLSLPAAITAAALVLPWTGEVLGAQEVRASLVQTLSDVPALGSPRGISVGLRYLPFRGVGLGVELDRLTSAATIRGQTCPPQGAEGEECTVEGIRMRSTSEAVTFLLMVHLGHADDWAFRVGIGRVAGTATGSGVGAETGREVEPPQADHGRGLLSWSRGADGGALGLEVLRRLPLPVPGPIYVQGAYRNRQTELEGCVPGEPSPYCGPQSMHEFQVGLWVGRFPGGG